MQHVVILGGGFGGLYAAKAVSGHAKVTLIDCRNFHLFQPLLYQVATGSLSPGEIAAPLRSLLRRHRDTFVLLDEAVDLDAENRRGLKLYYDHAEKLGLILQAKPLEWAAAKAEAVKL